MDRLLVLKCLKLLCLEEVMATLDLYCAIGIILLSVVSCFGPYLIPEVDLRGE